LIPASNKKEESKMAVIQVARQNKGALLIIINRACLSPASRQQKIKQYPRQPGSLASK
jgi:hypothetical protein